MLQAVIFDYDGVIANSDSFNKNGLMFAFKKLGLDFSEEVYKKFFTGKTIKDGTVIFLSSIGKIGLTDQLISLKLSYDNHYLSEVEPYEAAINFINVIKGKYVLAVASGARRNLIQSFLENYNLADAFKIVVTADDYKKGKPDPESYYLTVNKLGIKKENILVIEDSYNGVRAAKNAGLKCLAVTHTHLREDLENADFVFDSFEHVKIEELKI